MWKMHKNWKGNQRITNRDNRTFFYINFVMNKHTSSKLLSTKKSVMNSSESLQMFPHFDKHYSVLTLEDISLSKSSLDYCQQVEVPENI